MASISFTQRAYTQALEFINNFVNTLDENSNPGIELKLEFDDIYHRKNKYISKLKEETKELGYLEKQDTYNKSREQIEINAIHDMKASCWRIALKNGLFNE